MEIDKLLNEIYQELVRLYGQEVADQAQLSRIKSWAYVSLPSWDGRRWVVHPIAKTMQLAGLRELLLELREM
jgi:hypothetical protein